jgi:hypothetical protein
MPEEIARCSSEFPGAPSPPAMLNTESAEVIVKLAGCDQASSRFTSRAIDSVEPAGTCNVDTDEELIDGKHRGIALGICGMSAHPHCVPGPQARSPGREENAFKRFSGCNGMNAIIKFFDTYGAFALAGALLIGFAAAMCILNYTDYMHRY